MTAVFVCLANSACSKSQSPRQIANATAAQPASAQHSSAVSSSRSAADGESPQVTTTNTSPQQSASSQSQAGQSPGGNPPRLVASDETQGPFQIAGQTFTFVKHVQKIEGSKSPDDSSVEWWELRDAGGKAIYREQYKPSFQDGRFNDTEDVGARELKTKFGQGILLDGMSLPSAPNSGSWEQVFGLVNGKLTPFSGPISTEGEFIEETVDTFQPSALFRGQQPRTVSRDILTFRVWTGNFSIIYGVAIDWMQGTLRPAWTCMERTSKGPSTACRYKVQAEASPRTEMTFVRLFSEPDAGSVPKHAVIKPDSKIEFVEAQATMSWNSDEHNTTFGPASSDPIWLHIKVDGEDGWISGEEDFEAVGLPEAG